MVTRSRSIWQARIRRSQRTRHLGGSDGRNPIGFDVGRFSSLWRAICAQRAPSAWFSSASNVFGEARFGSPFTRR